MQRPSHRKFNELRPIEIELNVLKNALSSCLIKYGNTHVICSVSFENNVPPFLRGQGKGWVTAEYSMLPTSCAQRVRRELAGSRPNGRILEIQRLISRCLRSAVDLQMLGEKQIIVDCDVINADGGTRTAAITGSYVALYAAFRSLMKQRIIKHNPIKTQVAAVSCGVYRGNAVLDLDYAEDSVADADGNFVLSSDSKLIEVQSSAENNSFSEEQFLLMLQLAKDSMTHIFSVQNKALESLS